MNLKNIKSFVFNKYLGTVEYITMFLMSLTFNMMYYLLNFKNKDLEYVQALAARFANMTAGMLHQVIILKGKDPNYVAPVAPAIVESESKNYNYTQPAYQPPWIKGSFKDIKKHPVIASRLKLEAYQTPQNVSQVAIERIKETK